MPITPQAAKQAAEMFRKKEEEEAIASMCNFIDGLLSRGERLIRKDTLIGLVFDRPSREKECQALSLLFTSPYKNRVFELYRKAGWKVEDSNNEIAFSENISPREKNPWDKEF